MTILYYSKKTMNSYRYKSNKLRFLIPKKLDIIKIKFNFITLKKGKYEN